MKNIKKRNDLILLILLLVFSCILMGWFYFQTKKTQNKVNIWQNNTLIKSLDIKKNQSFVVEGENHSYNEVIIKDGQVWIGETDCPNKDCVRQGKISLNGQQLVCLPHKIVVEINHESEGEILDGISK